MGGGNRYSEHKGLCLQKKPESWDKGAEQLQRTAGVLGLAGLRETRGHSPEGTAAFRTAQWPGEICIFKKILLTYGSSVAEAGLGLEFKSLRLPAQYSFSPPQMVSPGLSTCV